LCTDLVTIVAVAVAVALTVAVADFVIATGGGR